jgi:Fe-S oxidoreductase
MKTSKVIAAINEDKGAPVFSKCGYSIVGNFGVLTFHDLCYLGCWNNIYEPPRGILKKVNTGRSKILPRLWMKRQADSAKTEG